MTKNKYTKEREFLIKKQNNKCYYCGCELDIKPKDNSIRYISTIDHIIPKSKVTNNSLSNLVVCCLKCNSSKCNRPLKEFREQFFINSIDSPKFTPKQIRWLVKNSNIIKNLEKLSSEYKFYGELHE